MNRGKHRLSALKGAPSRDSGFTLLELLIASSLLAVMMSLLVGSLRIGAKIWGEGERRADETSKMIATQQFLRSHLTLSLPLMEFPQQAANGLGNLGGQEEMNTGLTFRGKNDRLSYVGTLPPQVKGGLYKFELFLAKNGEEYDLMLGIRPFSSPAGRLTKDKAIEDVNLVENVEDFKISYLSRQIPNSPPPQWLPEWHEPAMPALIRLEVTPKGAQPWPAMTVAPKIEGRS